MELKVFRCAKCGQMVIVLKKTACPIMCCGQPMVELDPGTSDGAHEKHVPVCKVDGSTVTVTVGEVEHPMLEAHYIEWIALQTTNGLQRKDLKPGDAPKAEFALAAGEEVVAVYAYCNLHSLWKA